MTNVVECSNMVDKSELTQSQSPASSPPAQPPAHEHGWPQETVPYPIARAMEFCLENCQLSRCSREPNDSAGSIQQICRFPQHCSIVFRKEIS
jgi:hypothetical protein